MLKLSYLLRETGSNIWRNLSLTLASIVVVAVSLALFGSSLLVRYGVENSTERWEGGIEFVVWMQPEAEDAQQQAIADALDESAEIREWEFVDQAAVYTEFQEFFADQPTVVQTVTPDILPSSYRVVPVDPDADAVAALGRQFENRPGVRSVVFAGEVIKEVQSKANRVSNIMLITGIVLLGAAVLLILNTIVIAIGSRRREVEVMKLVGASNWFIRIPFMIEGLIQGLIGAVMALPVMWLVNRYVIEDINDSELLRLLQGFEVQSGEFAWTCILVLIVGAVGSAVGAILAVSRYLDV